jgi:hypothetical protein
VSHAPIRKALDDGLAIRGRWGSRSGQSLIESCLVLIIVCILFFGVFQISQLFAAKEVLQYAAGRGARAKTVGFNHFMVFKTVRVGAIPNAGRLVNPDWLGGPASQHVAEEPRIPLYLGSENWGQLDAILDYEDWDTISSPVAYELGDGTLRVSIHQNVSLTNYPLHHLYYANDSFEMDGENTLDSHASLYLDDFGW